MYILTNGEQSADVFTALEKTPTDLYKRAINPASQLLMTILKAPTDLGMSM